MKILIVEDDRTIDSIISEELNQWGYHTQSIGDFTTVYETFKIFNPDLVLMDISLPH